MNYNSVTVRGHDYTIALREMLPTIIGKRSKTVPEIAKAAGRRAQTVKCLIDLLHKDGAVHIKRWTRKRAGPFVACYFWGPGEDAERPKPMTGAERLERYRSTPKGQAAYEACRKRWKNSERGREYHRNYNKARWAREKITNGGLAAIDPLLAAIMGQRNQPEEKEQACT